MIWYFLMISWKVACLKSSLISLLVNGSLTEEFSPMRRLRQEYLIAPFLFLIVAKGLSGLMRQVLIGGTYLGHKVGES